jgi:hypothetical protein
MGENDTDEQENDEKNKNEMSEAEIDENLEDSFPASDAPSWTLGSNHGAATRQQSESDEPRKDES